MRSNRHSNNPSHPPEDGLDRGSVGLKLKLQRRSRTVRDAVRRQVGLLGDRSDHSDTADIINRAGSFTIDRSVTVACATASLATFEEPSIWRPISAAAAAIS